MPDTGAARSGSPLLRPFAYLAPLLCGLWLLSTSLGEPIPELGVYNAKRLLELWLFPALLLPVALHPGLRLRAVALLRAVPAPAGAALAAFFALGLASALRQEHPGYPLADVALYFLLFWGALTVAAGRGVLQRRFDAVALAAIALTGAGVLLLEAAGASAYLASGLQYSYRESLIRFAHPRLYNHFQTWTLPLLALLPAAFPRMSRVRGLTIALIGLQWYILLSTGARGSTISLVAAMTLVAMLVPRHRPGWLEFQGKGLVAGILIYGGVFALLKLAQPGLSAFVEQSLGRPLMTTSGRSHMWRLALEDMLRNPWLGSGPTRFSCDTTHYLASSPHSFPLQILGEWGLPAFLLLGGLFTWLTVRVLRRARDTSTGGDGYASLACVCLTTSFLAAAIHACVSGIPIAPASHVAGILVLGWFWGLSQCSAQSEKAGPSPGFRRACIVMLAVAFGSSAALLGFGTAELATLEERTAYAPDYGPAAPRFWLDGRTCLYRY